MKKKADDVSTFRLSMTSHTHTPFQIHNSVLLSCQTLISISAPPQRDTAQSLSLSPLGCRAAPNITHNTLHSFIRNSRRLSALSNAQHVFVCVIFLRRRVCFVRVAGRRVGGGRRHRGDARAGKVVPGTARRRVQLPQHHARAGGDGGVLDAPGHGQRPAVDGRRGRVLGGERRRHRPDDPLRRDFRLNLNKKICSNKQKRFLAKWTRAAGTLPRCDLGLWSGALMQLCAQCCYDFSLMLFFSGRRR